MVWKNYCKKRAYHEAGLNQGPSNFSLSGNSMAESYNRQQGHYKLSRKWVELINRTPQRCNSSGRSKGGRVAKRDSWEEKRKNSLFERLGIFLLQRGGRCGGGGDRKGWELTVEGTSVEDFAPGAATENLQRSGSEVVRRRRKKGGEVKRYSLVKKEKKGLPG